MAVPAQLTGRGLGPFGWRFPDIRSAGGYPYIAWLCWVPNLIAAEWIGSRLNASRQRADVAR